MMTMTMMWRRRRRRSAETPVLVVQRCSAAALQSAVGFDLRLKDECVSSSRRSDRSLTSVRPESGFSAASSCPRLTATSRINDNNNSKAQNCESLSLDKVKLCSAAARITFSSIQQEVEFVLPAAPFGCWQMSPLRPRLLLKTFCCFSSERNRSRPCAAAAAPAARCRFGANYVSLYPRCSRCAEHSLPPQDAARFLDWIAAFFSS
ncbi:uncharacterized protein V6R79_008514 [Siganus canaliculatus]